MIEFAVAASGGIPWFPVFLVALIVAFVYFCLKH